MIGIRLLMLSAVLMAGCASSPPASAPYTEPQPPSAPRVVAQRDASGALILKRSVQASVNGPEWLAGLREGDLLTYSVQLEDHAAVRMRYQVASLTRRGRGVAALLQPDSSSGLGLDARAHWLVGDDQALYRLQRDSVLADPDWVPLDAQGRVVPEVTQAALWRIPRGWPEREETASGKTWSAEELSMTLEGPVRGDRCAYIAKRDPEARIVICGNVGLVELRRGSEEKPVEQWELLEITSLGP